MVYARGAAQKVACAAHVFMYSLMSLRLAVPRLNAGTGNMTTVIDLGTVPNASGRVHAQLQVLPGMPHKTSACCACQSVSCANVHHTCCTPTRHVFIKTVSMV